MGYLTIADLFLIGLALDLAGAYILARGLLASPAIIVVASTSFWNSNPLLGVQGAEDRVDGRFGVGTLLAGFSLQVVGYVLDLAFSPSDDTGLNEALIALALAAVCGGAAMFVWWRLRPGLVEKTLIEMAHFKAARVGEPPSRLERPSAMKLADYGRAWKQDGREGETDYDYVHRAFKLDRADTSEESE